MEVVLKAVQNWNGNGRVTLEELIEKRGDVFYAFDSDENGELSAEEYDYFDEARKADMDSQADAKGTKKGKMQVGRIGKFICVQITDIRCLMI